MSLLTHPAPQGRYEAHVLVTELMNQQKGERTFLWRHNGDHVVVRAKSDATFRKNQLVEYSIDLTPHVKTSGKRRTVERAKLGEWIKTKLGQHGLRTMSMDISTIDGEIVRNGRRFRRPAFRVEGAGMVMDADTLSVAMNTGIGDAKAFGFGLLLIDEQ